MPRTTRKAAEDFDVPLRPVARHLWTGGHSPQRLGNALSLTLVQPEANASKVEFHVINIGAGHSVPTGSNRRGLYLRAEAVAADGKALANREWLFAPFYGKRPDDRSFLEEDKKLLDAKAAMQAAVDATATNDGRRWALTLGHAVAAASLRGMTTTGQRA